MLMAPGKEIECPLKKGICSQANNPLCLAGECAEMQSIHRDVIKTDYTPKTKINPPVETEQGGETTP